MYFILTFGIFFNFYLYNFFSDTGNFCVFWGHAISFNGLKAKNQFYYVYRKLVTFYLVIF